MEKNLNLREIANEMKAAQEQARQIEPFTSRFSDFDITSAYEVSRLIHKSQIDKGALAIGRKIGFTNPDMWSIYGVREPIWAHVYDRSVVQLSGSHINCHIERFTEPKIEPEIVIHFGSTPPESSNPVEILECVDWIANGIEIVQSHFPGWEFKAADTIADSALHATLLVGEPQYVNQLGTDLLSELEHFTINLFCDGALQEQGKGSNVLGSPLMAIEHLISILAKQPNAPSLKAGELVTTGTLTPALPVYVGQVWTTDLDGILLPNISVSFEI